MRTTCTRLKSFSLLAAFLVGNALCGLANAEKPSPVRFAPLPMESLDSMTREYFPFMDYLEKGLDRPFEMVYHASYETLLTEFLKGHIDLAYLGPLPYVVLKEQCPSVSPVVEFLDKAGSNTYTCSLIHFADHPVKIGAPSPKHVALTQPLSTCGYLSVEALLRRHNQSLENPNFDYNYVDSHENVALKVILGEYDIGGIKTDIAKQYQHLGVRIMEESDPMPGFLLIANNETLSEELIEKIRALILKLNPRENAGDRAITKSWGPKIKNGATIAIDSNYNSVREKWKATNIDLSQ